ncbi:hypothetical protein SAMN05216179_1054 [Gracilibacillus kekensis]|uniref:Uncharacterized protein n=1 Tax=Gracilibacillus kekensis TaxID=1027249 RepID=A0A1M7LFE9_9BACI|nr:hypothetical protein SAMN05216179_1054 [Gracilibacillus kekensis]
MYGNQIVRLEQHDVMHLDICLGDGRNTSIGINKNTFYGG